MSVIWSGITEEGAIVPVQVDSTGKVIATADVGGDYVKKTGDTMTGPLVLPGDPAENLQAATKQYVDNSAAGSGQLLAAGGTNTGGTALAYGINVGSVRKADEGIYQVYFQNPAFSANYVVLVTPTNKNRTYRVSSLNNLSFTIAFQITTSGNPSTEFTFAVFGPFPELKIAFS